MRYLCFALVACCPFVLIADEEASSETQVYFQQIIDVVQKQVEAKILPPCDDINVTPTALGIIWYKPMHEVLPYFDITPYPLKCVEIVNRFTSDDSWAHVYWFLNEVGMTYEYALRHHRHNNFFEPSNPRIHQVIIQATEESAALHVRLIQFSFELNAADWDLEWMPQVGRWDRIVPLEQVFPELVHSN